MAAKDPASEDSGLPFVPAPTPQRRWWAWALALVLAAGATAGGLAWAGGRSVPAPHTAAHVGNLAELSDADFVKFLPTREDFPKRQMGFLVRSAEELREHPDKPAPPMDPPRCDPMSPFRNISMLGEVRTERAGFTSYTIGVTRESAGDDLALDVDKWLAGCPEVALPSAVTSRGTRARKAVLEKLPEPKIGADRAISYVITSVDTSTTDPKDVLYEPVSSIMTVAVTRGVGLFFLARDTGPDTDAQERDWLLSKLTARIRTY